MQFTVPQFEITDASAALIPKFDAIWDTGATNSVISQKVVDALGLVPVSMVEVRGVNSTDRSPVYLVNIILPSKVICPAVAVTRGGIPGADALIGMDVITWGDFHISNVGGKTVMSFRVPSRDLINYVVDLEKRDQAISRKGHRPNPKKLKRR